MSSYPTIRNPLLPSPPPNTARSRFRKDLFSSISLSATATLTTSASANSIREFVTQTFSQIRLGQSRRIMPVMQKSMTEGQTDLKHHAKSSKNEPLVHYNGPYQTLESLPSEKLNWIKDEPTSSLLKNPLTNYEKSIVLRKPVTRSQTYPIITQNSALKAATKPKGMFYIRILQIVFTDSSKTRLFRCGIQVNRETCLSSYIASEKTGKKSCVAQFDETFLFDIDAPTTATISVYAQHKGGNIFQNKNHRQEVCIGQEVINIPLHPKPKSTERFVLSKSSDLQLLLVHGTFVSHRTQNMMNNTILYEDFITVYVRGSAAPRWDRFWGVLRGIQFELYDFEYKENRPPMYAIPLNNLINAFSTSQENEGGMMADIGAKGIGLQFTERAISRQDKEWAEDLEYRMYFLPETSTATREWENNFNYAASIFDEMRGWDNNDSTFSSEYSDNFNDESSSFYSSSSEEEEEEEEDKLYIPFKLLW